ncbi:MAG: LamG domain-containing protein [Candidatus Omnitrophica bacterium]|nr:LamG domain-containing protein [Candidatus Omnitrophota bacterium]
MRNARGLAASVVVWLVIAQGAVAAVPKLIRYQGTLVDSNNVPLEGSFALTFRIYDAFTGGTVLWTESQTAVPVSRGVFNVLLGQVTPLTLPFDKDYWLTTQVGPDAEMSPSQRLTSVPYAYRAGVAERLDTTPRFETDTAGTLTNGLIAYWKLDESSGTRADSKGTNTLTDHNTVAQTTGKVGNAAQLTAANSHYLSHASNTDLQLGNIDWTMCAWFYVNSLGTNTELLSKRNAATATNEYELRINSSNHAAIFQYNGGSGIVRAVGAGETFSTGTWYFVVAWHDATAHTLSIQVNNGAVSSDNTAGTPGTTTQPFLIGAQSEPSNFFDGRIDEVGLWKKVLTAQERADLYNGGQGNTYTAPTPPSSSPPQDISARVYNSADVPIPNNTNVVLPFDSERWDTDNMHDPAVNNDRLTFNTAGNYLVVAHVAFAPNATGHRFVRIRGPGGLDLAATEALGNSAESNYFTLSTYYHFNAGEFVQVLVQQSSGGVLAVQQTGHRCAVELEAVKVP